MLREIPEAETIVADDVFGLYPKDRERRFIIVFRANNGWDLDKIRAEWQNCAMLAQTIVGEILESLITFCQTNN